MKERRILITGGGQGAGRTIAAHMAAHSSCSDSPIVVNWDCCGNPTIRREDITGIYISRANGICADLREPKVKKAKPRRLKISGKQYARPFYIYEK